MFAVIEHVQKVENSIEATSDCQKHYYTREAAEYEAKILKKLAQSVDLAELVEIEIREFGNECENCGFEA